MNRRTPAALSTPQLSRMLLESLVQGPAFGTLLVSRIAEQTRGEVQLHSFRVYQALRAMARAGLIEPCQPVVAVTAGRAPIYYGLTEQGLAALRAAQRAA
jgi:DNA-binding PadR family transcriptional regulator